MIEIYSFFEVNEFVSNNPNSINPVGELSGIGATYAKDVRKYKSGGVSGGVLHVFFNSDSGGSDAVKLTQLATSMDAICKGIVNMVGSVTGTVLSLLPSGSTNLALGDFVLNPLDNINYPKWIKFDNNGFTYTVWLSNSSFISDYPTGEIQLILPLADMNLIVENFDLAKSFVHGLPPNYLSDKKNEIVRGVITGDRMLVLTCQNYQNETNSFQLPLLVVYNGGTRFCNLTNFLAKLKEYLLMMSSTPLNVWLSVFPQLEPVNKYYMMVEWKNKSVSNTSLSTPLLSPTIDSIPYDRLLADYHPDYTTEYLHQYLNYTVFLYKSAGVFVLPDKTNPDGVISFKNKYPDYNLTALNNILMNLMSPVTFEMSIVMDELLRLADSDNYNIANQPLYREEIKNNKRYLIKRLQNIDLAVLVNAG